MYRGCTFRKAITLILTRFHFKVIIIIIIIGRERSLSIYLEIGRPLE